MTIKDIAKLANVSPSTVSKIINGKAENIRPSTREKVLDIVREYHYSPDNFIRRSSPTRAYIIGLLLNTAFYNQELLSSIITAIKQFGYYPLVCCSNGNATDEKKFLAFLDSINADAIIWEKSDYICDTPHDSFNNLQIPCLRMHDETSDKSTQINYSAYGYLATEVLIKQRHNRIAFIAADSTFISHSLFLGFQQCLRSNKLNSILSEFVCFADCSAFDLLKAGYTAAVCVGNDIGVSIHRQMELLHCSVPQDFSLVVLAAKSEKVEIPLSTVSIPYKEYGEFLVQYLMQILNHSDKLSTFSPVFPSEVSMISIAPPKSSPSKHIVVVGSIHMDVSINSPDLPQLGQTVVVKGITALPGGKGLNQAIGVAKLNKEVHLIGRVGSDFDGVIVQNTLNNCNVNSSGIIQDNCDTGRAFIYILENGESAITYFDGANNNLSVDDINASSHLFSNADFCLLQSEIPMPALMHAAKLAHACGAKVIFKPSALTEISNDLLSIVDYFVPNEKEMNTLCPHISTQREQCQFFLDQGVKNVILTLGSCGCYLCNETDSCYFPASDHTVNDTTGGSDAFISALAVYLSEGSSLYQAIQYAIYAAGFCISRQGVFPALVDRESLELYFKQQAAKST